MRRAKSALRALAAAAGAVVLASCSLTLFSYASDGRRYALVYGVTLYKSGVPAGTYPNLSYPDSDAQSVATMLRSQGYSVLLRYVDQAGAEYRQLPTDPVPVLQANISTDPNGTKGPSKANIVPDIQTYFQGVGPDDVFVFYFSGHGMQDASQSPPVEYIVPEGGVNSNGDGLPVMSVSDVELGGMLGALDTKRKVVILDTCNSGGFIGNSLEADGTLPASGGRSGGISPQTLAQAVSNYVSSPTSSSGLSPYGGAMVLSAAGRDESCYESPSPYNHGVMTYYLLQAPQSGDLNHDGHVTVGEAFSLVKAGIDTDWNRTEASAGYGFEPRISGGPVDFTLW